MLMIKLLTLLFAFVIVEMVINDSVFSINDIF